MIIRKATPEDLEGICKVMNAVKLDYDNPQKCGFLAYGLNHEGYAQRITSSDYFYVALNEDEVVGFLMCYDNETLKGLMKSGELDHDDMLTKRVSEQQGKYIYGDQIGVIPDRTLNGVGTSMMETLFDEMRRTEIFDMYVGILHEPAMNSASKKFCERLGFSHQESVRNSDNHLWGIYKLQLSSSQH